jgi:hypothetical protein
MFMPTPVAPTAAAAPPASTPTEALNHLFALRDVNQAVTVTLDTSRVRIGKDKLKFSVQSAQSGYLYILMVGTDMAPVHLLFPNELDRKNQISAGKEISLPRSGWAMTAGGPPGTDHFVALVSATPRDFKGLGLKKDGPFAAFSQEAVNQATRDRPGVAALAGQAVCKPADACNPAYGAAQFSVEETR